MAIVFAVVMTFALGLYFDAVIDLCMQAAGQAFPGLPAGDLIG
jgi:hypothetical protein